ncbi:large subunit of alpha-aminoadipate reductase [Geranomyces michiganensis]|nr:large subunit of alpha-aminoadipate reductase [Geranomyces michiganensis]
MPSQLLSSSADDGGTSARVAQWKDKLANRTELLLPTDFPRPVPNRIVDAEQLLHVPDHVSLAILQLSMGTANSPSSTELPPTPFTILLAAFAILLHRYTGEEDITLGSSSQSSNPLVLRFPITSASTMRSVVKTVLQAEQDAMAIEVPFHTLLAALFPQTAEYKDAHEPSPFKVRFFNLTDTTPDTLSSTTTSSSCDITIFISQEPTLRRLLPIDIRVVYNSVLFANTRITDMLAQLQQLLTTALGRIDEPIGNLSLVTDESRLVLPNPYDDLHWDQFEGAITDIFARNARTHPTRTCVVESRVDNHDENSQMSPPLREFSYQAINEASNILAHHLARNGIQRGDVIVLYSYRGVDLVVAVMGVLKAGAVFSVIDPAYPPARQNVYLSVARPRGLVVLAKAGALHEDVRSYIRDNLDVRCTVPSLEIADDGELCGGLGPDGQDVFAADQALKASELGIQLGPDSPCTLSFTSGSTGIPKGVQGRHFSLTHFYPWMSKTFDLTPEARFTMLSGIAHDPIQRDIFTPLFLGAQLRIPTAEDIGSPGRLAEWMAEHGITVTHLTPAMGQLLSANATTPIPTLRHAFFVGDVLTKRDVLRLQYLAPNTHVVNMYGTTETQRAVSYMTIPPSNNNPGFLSELKDIMPAGKGMRNVQLLVVNAAGALCGIGEVGEIYVRSSGLAEGYLDEKATKEKFVRNPFGAAATVAAPAKLDGNGDKDPSIPYYMGARDRCYRSGDLGRYRPDGSVECTGRADDQVKIRGFRIELKEIDTHLSQCEDVRENVTLIRRDKDEEKVLISYIVPNDSSKDLGLLIRAVREHLKSKLASYAVPGVIVPLKRMPLTPNGKVDKNALPFPDTAMLVPPPSAATSTAALSPHQASVRHIWATVLNIPAESVQLDDNFFDLGGHSILATRLVFAIRKTMKVDDLPLGIVYREPTVRGMSAEIERVRERDLGLATASQNGDANPAVASAADGKRPDNKDDNDTVDYAADLDVLDGESIEATGHTAPSYPIMDGQPKTFFLTGATGFLGAFILADVLKRHTTSRVVALVRAKDQLSGLERLRQNSRRYLAWNEEWVSSARVSVLCGDLAKDRLGLSEAEWTALGAQADIIIHNGALVHWVYPYHKLRPANVLGTLWALRLAASQPRLKPFCFVSSTSVLDTPHYIRDPGVHVMEDDDLEGSRTGLRSGYGQTKWVAEKLVMRARARGVPAAIVRPGYVVGDAKAGICNTDDFLWRMLKGCVQLGKVPRIANIVNMCPVDYVAAVTVAVATSDDVARIASGRGVFHCYNPDAVKFDDMFGQLVAAGYAVVPTDYIHWRTALMELTLAAPPLTAAENNNHSTNDEERNALYPLLHFVLDDLPTSTKAPQLDTRNARAVVAAAAPRITNGEGEEEGGAIRCGSFRELGPLYIGYLVHAGFLPPPPPPSQQTAGDVQKLVKLREWDEVVMTTLGGRTGA